MARLVRVVAGEWAHYGPIRVPVEVPPTAELAQAMADLLGYAQVPESCRHLHQNLIGDLRQLSESLRSLRRIRAANREREGLPAEPAPQAQEDTVLSYEAAIARLEEWRSSLPNRQWRLGRLADGSWSVLLMEGFDDLVAQTFSSLKGAVDLALGGKTDA